MACSYHEKGHGGQNNNQKYLRGGDEISMAVSALVRLSEDKITRQAYQRRQDEIVLYNKKARDYEQMKQRAEQAEAENEMLRKRLAELEVQSKA